MIDPREYNISVRYGVFDDETCFEARIREFPDVAEYGDSFEEAYNLALDTVETVACALKECGRSVPTPMASEDDYSGRVTLRVPKSLHRNLAMTAEDEGVSLNHLMVSILSAFRGFDLALQESRDGWSNVIQGPTEQAPAADGKVISLRKYQEQAAAGW